MRTVAIIQARMGSTRLPHKVLMYVSGQTMLERVVRRTQKAPFIDEIVVATTTSALDDPLVAECARLDVGVFRGSEMDVLGRYYGASVAHNAEAIVRITSDCPLIDPEVTGKTVEAFLNERPDYAANILDRTYPRGLDTEVFTFDALACAHAEASDAFDREHVTDYIMERPNRFRHVSVRHDADCSKGRWTVDTAEDLAFVRAVYAHFDGDDYVSWRQVWDFLKAHPELDAINRHVRQKTREGN
ncbi:MAG TPA: glycosyltransferase family protein [Candidatus Hydrogenedentes bacterium]|nr:glycosyltransferase family protein [Candidatus Hydrogenedentota bacterium]HOS03897.1 glycosyltransferase family protein [Candidatus Hydrogenedentota bacterium]